MKHWIAVLVAIVGHQITVEVGRQIAVEVGRQIARDVGRKITGEVVSILSEAVARTD